MSSLFLPPSRPSLPPSLLPFPFPFPSPSPSFPIPEQIAFDRFAGVFGPPLRRTLPPESQDKASLEGGDPCREEEGCRPQDGHGFRGEARPPAGGEGIIAGATGARWWQGAERLVVFHQELRV